MYKKDQRKRVDWHTFHVLWNWVFKHAKCWDFHKKLHKQIHNSAIINFIFSDFCHYLFFLKCTFRNTHADTDIHREVISIFIQIKKKNHKKRWKKLSINCSKQYLCSLFFFFFNFVCFMGSSIKYSPKQPAFFM